jgi:hypothetical protein
MPDGRLVQASALERHPPGQWRSATIFRCLSADGEEIWEKSIPGVGGLNNEAAALLGDDGGIWFASRGPAGVVVGQLAPEVLPAAGPGLVIQDVPEFHPGHPNGYFSVNGPSTTRFVWEGSADLSAWAPLSTNLLEVHDLKFPADSENPAAHWFFRARSIP